jgi:hypothetical protein
MYSWPPVGQGQTVCMDNTEPRITRILYASFLNRVLSNNDVHDVNDYAVGMTGL